jgi:DNA invertase Pin-like site-specific DNA recombinase
MNYAYIRFSTDKQDESQQAQAIKEWAEPRGITIDYIAKDEGVSGGVSYRDRNLYGLVHKMKKGDVLIVSEISRLGRSMSDLNKLINEELKPRGVRLIVIKMGLDLDCANLKAIDEMIFFAFSFAAQIEKEMIQQRTQSAMDLRKSLIETEGGFVSKEGNWCKHLGRKKGCDLSKARTAAAAVSVSKAKDWRENSPLYSWVTIQVFKRRPRKDILAEAAELYEKNPEKYCTREGKVLSPGHLSVWVREIQKEL